MDGDFKLNENRWGANIVLTRPDEFHKLDLEKDLVPVGGHRTPRPLPGHTLVGEFQKSWIKFCFIEVEYCRDPSDMFFAKVKAVEQHTK